MNLKDGVSAILIYIGFSQYPSYPQVENGNWGKRAGGEDEARRNRRLVTVYRDHILSVQEVLTLFIKGLKTFLIYNILVEPVLIALIT